MSIAPYHLRLPPSEVSKFLSSEGDLRGSSISLVASGNLLFMGSILIFKSRVLIHGHHILCMHAYTVSWHGISNPPGPSVFNIYYLTSDTGTMFKL